jgi:acyl-CoA thioesterase FadM
MFPLLRTIRVGFSLIGQSKIDLLATTSVRLRVWPNDLDGNMHVNNGRYLALADIGRIHWFGRAGLMGVARKQKVLPVVSDAIAKFRRELKAFQTFDIHTRLIGWDSKCAFIEHRFMRDNRVLGVVAIRGVFKGPNGPIDPNVFLAALTHATPSPPLPEWAQSFHSSCESLSSLLREAERKAT